MWLLILAIVILALSATFAAYLAEFYTASFQIATFAKSTSMVLFFAGIITLFVAVGWWGFAGIVGWWLLFAVERVSWRKMLQRHLKAGINPYISSLEASKKAAEGLKRYAMEHGEEEGKMKLKRTLCVVFGTLIAYFVSPIAGAITEVGFVEGYEAVGFWALFPFLLLSLGLGLTMYGCYLWAKLKGRHWAWLFAGLFTPIGLFVLWALKDKRQQLSSG